MKHNKKSLNKQLLPSLHHHSSTFSGVETLNPSSCQSPSLLAYSSKPELRKNIFLLTAGSSQSRTPVPTDISDSQTFRKSLQKSTKSECLSDRSSSQSFNSAVLKTKLDLVLALRSLVDDRKEKEKSRSLNRTKMIIKALEILSNEDGRYKDELRNIVQEIRNSVFIAKEEIEAEVLEHIYEKYPETLTDLDGLIPFYYLYPLNFKRKDSEDYCSIETVNKMKENYASEINTLKEEVAKFTELFQSKEKDNKKLSEETSKYKQEIQQKTKENFILLNKVSVLEREVINLRTCGDEDNKNIIGLQKKLKNYEETLQKSTSDYNFLNRNFYELKQKNDSMTNGYSTILCKLKQSYEVQEELERQISDLMKTNSILSDRAAVGYEGLTPRPNLAPIFKFLEVEIPNGSTVEKTNKLLKEIKAKELKKTVVRRGNTLRTTKIHSFQRKNSGLGDESKRSEEASTIQLQIPSIGND
ncbi:unnamed protein product [Blepharisma stoltei]|uniref:Translin-associated factor X-interacting protein 1 N-terminal domain-containing protein n=1 Tax=Blepharisma stoltei TaxID=1481888 RepID=A0AAU9K4K6_9CILI|nr:unnamed protein product [Blepharisma stoltei]